MTTGTIHLRWVAAPPPANRTGWGLYDHNLIARTLRQHHGEWAELHEMGVNAAQAIRSGLAAAYRPAGSFEAVVRRGAVYARYLGPGGA